VVVAEVTESTRHVGAVVVVTGAARGIGFSCAQLLVAQGARVVVADVDGPAAEAAAHELGTAAAIGVSVDVRSQADCAAMVAAGRDAFGRITGLVHAAGVNQPPCPIAELTDEEWRRVLDINLSGTLFAIQAVSPYLAEGGAIVTFASGAARVVRKGIAAYAASKAGVVALTKVAALELGPQGVRVNAIAPGFIDTEMNQAKLTPERRAAIARSAPLGRVGRPDEIARVTSFLLSAESSYVSGDVIAVDGGVAAPSRP
jgi:3alpha(or 20beta)-hydroxysteroid dehydrogenase